jgi:hypothetical protein
VHEMQYTSLFLFEQNTNKSRKFLTLTEVKNTERGLCSILISITAKCDQLSPRDLQPRNEEPLLSRGKRKQGRCHVAPFHSARDYSTHSPSAGGISPSEGTPSVNPRSTKLNISRDY